MAWARRKFQQQFYDRIAQVRACWHQFAGAGVVWGCGACWPQQQRFRSCAATQVAPSDLHAATAAGLMAVCQ